MSSYARPSDLTDVLGMTARGFRVLAGGTDLYPSAGWGLSGDVVDVTAVPALHGIKMGKGLRIGSCVTWSQIAEAQLPPALHALQQAALQIGGRQVQNVGTIGGNICNASPAADGIPPLLVLSAEVEIAGPGGTRRMPLAQCVQGPRKVALASDEILLAIHIPEEALQGRSAFVKLGARSHLVISMVMAALRLVTRNGRITEASAAIGACGPTARRLPAFEQALVGQSLDAINIHPGLIHAALAPIDDIRATAGYRAEAAVTLLRRLVAEVGQ